MEVLRDLEILILSRCPIIAVETYEEERIEEGLKGVAAKLGIPLLSGLSPEGSSVPEKATRSTIANIPSRLWVT